MDTPRPESDAASPPIGEPPVEASPGARPEPVSPPDLERIAGDLADVDIALDRLRDGSYWTDEVTGEPIPDEVLAADPTARRVAYLAARPESMAPPEAATEQPDDADPPGV